VADLFDAAAMYDEDYLYFFAAPGGHTQFAAHGPVVPGAGAPAGAAADLAWRLLDLAPGLSVLDLACGHGELAGALAARGCAVTGLDPSAAFLDRARADAAAARVSVEYVAGDMRELPWAGRFDRVVSWSTAFGYFDDDVNRAVLDQIARVLRPGGRFEAERTVIRDGRARKLTFVKRLFGFPELRDWLLAAGFTAVAGYGEDGQPLNAGYQRMAIVAGRP